MAVRQEDWLALIETEYLARFVPAGGSAVKFVVSPDPVRTARLIGDLRDMAHRNRMVHVSLDSAETRLHMIQDVFFSISRQIDWTSLAQQFMENLFASQGYAWPRPGEVVTTHQLAAANRVDLVILRRDLRQWLTSAIMRDAEMARDFRIAMLQLCLDRQAPEGEAGAAALPVLAWLRGELRTVGALRSAQIFTKITRHNARSMLRSLCRWLRLLNHRGLVVTIDIARLVSVVPTGSPGVRYAPAAVLDGYEVLRQLIDEAEEFDGLFVAVLADPAFVGVDRRRSIEAYTALKLRIWDDVRARDQDNPLAPLVTMAGEAAA